MGIKENVAAHIATEDLLGMVPDVLPPSAEKEFWETLIKKAQRNLGIEPPAVVDDSMTYEETYDFERQIVPTKYRAFAGKQVSDVPPSYWLYLHEKDAFDKDLSRYLRSMRFQDRQDA